MPETSIRRRSELYKWCTIYGEVCSEGVFNTPSEYRYGGYMVKKNGRYHVKFANIVEVEIFDLGSLRNVYLSAKQTLEKNPDSRVGIQRNTDL